MSPSDPPFPPRRRHMADRRPALTFKLDHDTASGARHRFHVTIGLYDRGSSDVGEIFINTAGKSGSESDVLVADAAVAISLALQYGCPIDTLRTAMKRESDGYPSGLLSRVLDEVANVVRGES